MHITVTPRVIAAPWERESMLRIVGLEADVVPEAGPLELYVGVFGREREVRWDYDYQSFAIYHCNPGEPEELIERLTYWDSAPDPVTGKELTDEQIAAMAGRSLDVVRRFMPFDYQFVNRRLKGRYEIQHDGANKHRQRIADRNAMRQRTIKKDYARDLAAAANEIKDWLPVLNEFEQTGKLNVGMRTARGRGASFTPAAPAVSAPAHSLIIASR